MIHTFKVAVLAFLYTVRHGIPIMWRARRRSSHLVETCRYHPRTWARRILRAAGVEVVVEGAEHIDADAPRILVANHQSWFDVFALTAYLPGDYRFVAKKELEGIPIFGPAWQACGHISIDRGDLQKAIGALEKAAEVVRRERPTLIMFPEGTRSSTGEIGPFKKGAFVLALQLDAPLLPTAILGTREVMAKGDWRIRPGRVRIRIGAPIPVGGPDGGDRDVLARTARSAVGRLLAGAPLDGPWETPPRLTSASEDEGGPAPPGERVQSSDS